METSDKGFGIRMVWGMGGLVSVVVRIQTYPPAEGFRIQEH